MTIVSWWEDCGDELFQNFNLSLLRRDEAYLNIVNNSSSPIELYSLLTECVQCPYTKEKFEKQLDPSNVIIGTEYEKLLQVRSANDVLCNIEPNFGEFGIYKLQVFENKSCRFDVLKEPVSIYFSILTVLLIYTIISTLVYSVISVWYVYVRHHFHNSEAEVIPAKNRVKSLDTFRGIAIILMIFVNYGCGGYVIFEHAIWNGLHLSDLVFPWFMWIMGCCIPITTLSTFNKKISNSDAVWNILRRSCLLFIIGIFLSSSVYLEYIRVFGVLQRFGVCYFVVATSCILLSKVEDFQEGKGKFQDLIAIRFQWIVATICLLIHLYYTFLFEVPNCIRGYVGPGGNHENGTHFDCTGGATGYIDRKILGNHVYQRPTTSKIYGSGPFDPEGPFGCLTSIIQVILGAQAGATLVLYKNDKERLKRWIIWGVISGLLGAILCGFSKEDGLIPINKNLWSLSFVLVTSALAFFLLSICYFLVDVKESWSGKPFLFCGMNAIFLYIAHSLCYQRFPIRWIPTREFGFRTHFAMLSENVWATGVFILIAYYMYKKKIFFTI